MDNAQAIATLNKRYLNAHKNRWFIVVHAIYAQINMMNAMNLCIAQLLAIIRLIQTHIFVEMVHKSAFQI